jgi:hypothetical protein
MATTPSEDRASGSVGAHQSDDVGPLQPAQVHDPHPLLHVGAPALVTEKDQVRIGGVDQNGWGNRDAMSFAYPSLSTGRFRNP